MRKLNVETLEDRTCPAVSGVWSGAGLDHLWTNLANWGLPGMPAVVYPDGPLDTAFIGGGADVEYDGSGSLGYLELSESKITLDKDLTINQQFLVEGDIDTDGHDLILSCAGPWANSWTGGEIGDHDPVGHFRLLRQSQLWIEEGDGAPVVLGTSLVIGGTASVRVAGISVPFDGGNLHVVVKELSTLMFYGLATESCAFGPSAQDSGSDLTISGGSVQFMGPVREVVNLGVVNDGGRLWVKGGAEASLPFSSTASEGLSYLQVHSEGEEPILRMGNYVISDDSRLTAACGIEVRSGRVELSGDGTSRVDTGTAGWYMVSGTVIFTNGTSRGRLTVDGELRFGADSELVIHAQRLEEQSDRLTLSSVTFDAGCTLSVYLDGGLGDATEWQFLYSAAEMVGGFTNVTGGYVQTIVSDGHIINLTAV